MSNVFKLFFILCFSFLTHLSYGNSVDKLQAYIDKNCKSGCVDASLLAMAIEKASTETGASQNMLIAIIKPESNFQTKSINKNKGKSVGLFQIQVRWHREKFRSRNYSDVFENVRAGALVYKGCMDKWNGSKERALWCYNGHQKFGMKNYVPKVLLAYREISQLRVF